MYGVHTGLCHQCHHEVLGYRDSKAFGIESYVRSMYVGGISRALRSTQKHVPHRGPGGYGTTSFLKKKKRSESRHAHANPDSQLMENRACVSKSTSSMMEVVPPSLESNKHCVVSACGL